MHLRPCSNKTWTFQSTPAITGGRAAKHVQFQHARLIVSIHARHYWRASPASLRDSPFVGLVSIHARHYWRASQVVDVDPSGVWIVSIHARHYWRASPLGGTKATAPRMFQSTPAITGGRALFSEFSGTGVACFNPRPPLLAGEPRCASPFLVF